MAREIPDETLDLLIGYALNNLEPEEVLEARRLLDADPSLQTVVSGFQRVADHLPHALPITAPPAHLRAQTLTHATGQARNKRAAPPTRQWRAALQRLLAPLSLVSSAAALLLAWQISGLRGEISGLEQALAQRETREALVAQTVAQPAANISLEGAAGRAEVYRATDGTVVVAVALPPLEAGLVYQLWEIGASGVPASVGVFGVDAGGSALFDYRSSAQAEGLILAITVEPAPGSPMPTSDPLIAGTLDG